MRYTFWILFYCDAFLCAPSKLLAALQPGIARASSIGAWSQIGMRGFLKRPAGHMLLWFSGVPFLS